MSQGDEKLVTKDLTKELNATISLLKNIEVLVGIPASENERDGEFGNAAILSLNHFGSEDLGIPPRPVLEIGIRLAQEKIAQAFKAAVKAGIEKGPEDANRYLEMAGMIASQSVKNVINEQIEIKEPSTATLKIREAAGFKGTKSLLVTGQLRNAITYVVTNKKG